MILVEGRSLWGVKWDYEKTSPKSLGKTMRMRIYKWDIKLWRSVVISRLRLARYLCRCTIQNKNIFLIAGISIRASSCNYWFPFVYIFLDSIYEPLYLWKYLVLINFNEQSANDTKGMRCEGWWLRTIALEWCISPTEVDIYFLCITTNTGAASLLWLPLSPPH